MPSKRIVICLDGTWNDPEDEIPTNVLKVARAVRPTASDNTEQVVFYDWGVGSYYAPLRGGAAGLGMMKNIQDGYRFIVQNYDPGDQLYLFGFSRGAYTARALAGMLNNCGILKREHAHLIPRAFRFYKKQSAPPGSAEASRWRTDYAVNGVRGTVDYLGVWDTVGALGIPTRALAFVEENDLFFDPVLGSNVRCARHALAIDEKRSDFEPTLWQSTEARNVKQVWFAGVHGDIGGGAKGKNGRFLSDIALYWLTREANDRNLGLGLEFEAHLHVDVSGHHRVEPNRSYRKFYRMLGEKVRRIPKEGVVHASVKERYEHSDYTPKPLREWLKLNNGWGNLEF